MLSTWLSTYNRTAPGTVSRKQSSNTHFSRKPARRPGSSISRHRAYTQISPQPSGSSHPGGLHFNGTEPHWTQRLQKSVSLPAGFHTPPPTGRWQISPARRQTVSNYLIPLVGVYTNRSPSEPPFCQIMTSDHSVERSVCSIETFTHRDLFPVGLEGNPLPALARWYHLHKVEGRSLSLEDSLVEKC